MTKTELTKQMATDAGISIQAAQDAIQSLINGITDALKTESGKITLTGFGTFLTSHREARMGKNPVTGEAIHIPARNVVRFKAGKKLKETV
ncbi:HupA: DNA-binding protein HU 1 [Desulfosarcina variabilis str. Montpellier]|uniref:HU family DNA-binding protein n=1 Tax=Desulfosarcina variabilis TaxID=2300 RepID=UPI003AFB51AC